MTWCADPEAQHHERQQGGETSPGKVLIPVDDADGDAEPDAAVEDEACENLDGADDRLALGPVASGSYCAQRQHEAAEVETPAVLGRDGGDRPGR